jgi:hypothetical protein
LLVSLPSLPFGSRSEFVALQPNTAFAYEGTCHVVLVVNDYPRTDHQSDKISASVPLMISFIFVMQCEDSILCLRLTDRLTLHVVSAPQAGPPVIRHKRSQPAPSVPPIFKVVNGTWVHFRLSCCMVSAMNRKHNIVIYSALPACKTCAVRERDARDDCPLCDRLDRVVHAAMESDSASRVVLSRETTKMPFIRGARVELLPCGRATRRRSAAQVLRRRC